MLFPSLSLVGCQFYSQKVASSQKKTVGILFETYASFISIASDYKDKLLC